MPRDHDGKPDKPTAYDKAMGWLVRREYSSRELRLKLRQKGYEDEETILALDRLGEQRYQDDERFAEALIRQRAAQGYGPLRVRAELAGHGLPQARIRELIDAADIDWIALAVRQLSRRYAAGCTQDAADQGRRAQFLLRRGFSAATVRSLTRANVDAAADDA